MQVKTRYIDKAPVDPMYAPALRYLDSLAVIRLVAAVCFATAMIPIWFLQLDSNREQLAQQVIWFVVGSLAYLAVYATVPLTIAGLMITALSDKGWRTLTGQLAGLWRFWIFAVYVALQFVFSHFTENVPWLLKAAVNPAIALALLFPTPSEARGLFRVVGLYSILVVTGLALSGGGVFVLARGAGSQEGRFGGSISPIAITNALLYCALALTCYAICVCKNAKLRAVCFLPIFGLVLSAFFCASRGPIASFAVCVCVVIAMGKPTRSVKVVALVLVIVAALAGFLVVQRYVPEAYDKLVSGDNRMDTYSLALSRPPTLFGYGVGSFSAYWGGSDTDFGYIYPHNMFLEAYFEYGIMGVALLFWLLVSSARDMLSAYRRTRDHIMLWVFVSFLYFLICGQFSGGMLANSQLWTFCILGVCLSSLVTKAKTSEGQNVKRFNRPPATNSLPISRLSGGTPIG